MGDEANCELCGEPMPQGEEMFNYHGYSGPCPKPPLPKKAAVDHAALYQAVLIPLQEYRAKHKECRDLTGHPDAMPSQRKDWRCDACKIADEHLTPLPAPPEANQ
jgi:hypothetical protein